MSKRECPTRSLRDWLQPLSRREIRRDYCKYAGDTARGKRHLLSATGALSTFDRPVLVVWAIEAQIREFVAAGRPVTRPRYWGEA
jgi:hypothetical protein